MNNNHQRPECIHSNGYKALFALRKIILNGERERVVKHTVALGKRHTVLLDVCRILFRVEFSGNTYNICTQYIFVNNLPDRYVSGLLSANEAA